MSGAHINPAVTVGFCVAGRCPDYEVLPYLAAQATGAFLASGVLWLMFPSEVTRDTAPTVQVQPGGPMVNVEQSEVAHGFGATRPWDQRQPTYRQATQAFWLELVLTFILMLVVLSVSHGPKEKGITAGIVVGSVIGLEALFAGPISGASMNPIRSLAPAAFAGELTQGWMWLCYVVAPVTGALLAVPAFQVIHQPKPRAAEGGAP